MNGKLPGIEGFMVDISQRKHMEQALIQANEELESRVSKRTVELEEKTARLERINKLFVDRELYMKPLKEEIIELKSELAENNN